MKDYIVKTTRSLRAQWIAETFSIVYVTVFRFFIYLMYENTGAVDDWIAKKLV